MNTMRFIPAILTLTMLAVLARPAAAPALHLGKTLVHYSMDMEFYYERPRPEIIPAMLRDFEREGVLAIAEKRMMVAAFLAEAMSRYPDVASSVAGLDRGLGRDGRATLAWAVRLSGLPDSSPWLEELLNGAPQALSSQIRHAATPLAAWRLTSEKSVLQMYWGAFMASGDRDWVLKIVRAACVYARLNARGRQRDPEFAVCRAAAASLYEMAPRHATVRTCVSEALSDASGPEAQALGLIMENGERGRRH